MSAEAALLLISRLITLTSSAMALSLQLQSISDLLKRAHAEGRTLTVEDWSQLDAQLDEARKAAEAARPAG